MKYIKIINDIDFNLELNELNNPKKRIGARGLVFNENGKIAILNKTNKNEYKLVGGGVEDGEDPKIAMIRETKEESGCVIEIDDFIGVIKEERTKNNFIQESYVYIAHVINDTKELDLTEKEIDEGARLLWMSIDEAMEKIRKCANILKPSKYADIYNSNFIVRRDYEILKYYKEKYINR